MQDPAKNPNNVARPSDINAILQTNYISIPEKKRKIIGTFSLPQYLAGWHRAKRFFSAESSLFSIIMDSGYRGVPRI